MRGATGPHAAAVITIDAGTATTSSRTRRRRQDRGTCAIKPSDAMTQRVIGTPAQLDHAAFARPQRGAKARHRRVRATRSAGCRLRARRYGSRPPGDSDMCRMVRSGGPPPPSPESSTGPGHSAGHEHSTDIRSAILAPPISTMHTRYALSAEVHLAVGLVAHRRGPARTAHRHRASRAEGARARRVRRDMDLAQPAACVPYRPGPWRRADRRGHRRQPVPRLRRRDRGEFDRPFAPAGRRRDQGAGRRAHPFLRVRLLPADLSRGLPRAGAHRPDPWASACVPRELRARRSSRRRSSSPGSPRSGRTSSPSWAPSTAGPTAPSR